MDEGPGSNAGAFACAAPALSATVSPPPSGRALLQCLEVLASEELSALQRHATTQTTQDPRDHALASLAWDLGMDARDFPPG